jgi:ABC-type dipeptide/oligopeptide/nickel transport system permease subunit
MLFTASSYLYQAPWYGFYPGLFLMALVLGLNLISEGLQEALARAG